MTTRDNRIRFVSILMLLMVGVAHAAGRFTNLGPQIVGTTIQGSLFARDASGRVTVYTVERGRPAHFLGYDVASMELKVDLLIPGTDGGWNITRASDGSIYLPGIDGHLFRYRDGDAQLEDLGVVIDGETITWDLVAGADSEVFGATYPGCRVFRYSPKDGFSDVGRGPLMKEENYVRCVAYQPATRKIYAGVGSHAHLIELDPKTGQKTELLAKEVAGQEAVYSLNLIPDEKNGDRLLAWVTNRNKTIVYNLKTKKIELEIPTQAIKSAIQSPDASTIYYGDGTQLMSFAMNKLDEPPKAIGRCVGDNAGTWLGDDELCVLTRYGQLLSYHPSSGQSSMRTLTIPPQPIEIQSIELGPDGKLWLGGFLAGGVASFDPATAKTEHYTGMSQIERIGVLGSKMYFGVYPHARFYEFDPAKPWGENNPRQFAQVEGQSRPIAIAASPKREKLFFGTVPEYGLLGGHLMAYSTKTNQFKDFGEVVPRQSIVSLLDTDAGLIGGTSVTGGLGIEPVETEAKLFGFDPHSGKATFQLVPVPRATAVTALLPMPDHQIFGIANGTLFVFDSSQQKVISTHELFHVDYAARHHQVWRDGFLIRHASGMIYGVLAGRLFSLDPKSLHVTVLRDEGVELLTIDRDGRLYFKDTLNLWRYDPE